MTPQLQRAKQFADARQYEAAVTAYEDALRADPPSARAHLELGLILDEKFGDPIGAIYHYRNFLQLEPNSDKRRLVQDFIERAKLSLAAKLPQPAAVDPGQLQRLQTERTALMQENAILKARVADMESAARPAATPVAAAPTPPAIFMAAAPVSSPTTDVVPATTATQPRTHVVQQGDTLQSIALRCYGTRAEWAKIFDANRTILESKDRLKIGQRLVVP